MKWVKASKTQWFHDNGETWVGISKRSGYYWLWTCDKSHKNIEVEATIYTRLLAAKEAAKDLK